MVISGNSLIAVVEVKSQVGSFGNNFNNRVRLASSIYYIKWNDIQQLIDYPGEILEVGRSCIEKDARNTATMQMLWRGTALYSNHYNIQVMFGCPSFPGTDPAQHSQGLSYLYHHHLAPP